MTKTATEKKYKMIQVDSGTHAQLKEMAGETPLAQYLRQIAGTDVERKPDRFEELAKAIVFHSGQLDRTKEFIEMVHSDLNKLEERDNILKEGILETNTRISGLESNQETILKALEKLTEWTNNLHKQVDSLAEGTKDAFGAVHNNYERQRNGYNLHIKEFHSGK